MEYDLEDLELQDGQQMQPEVIELTDKVEQLASQGELRPPSPTEATQDTSQRKELDQMEENEGDAPAQNMPPLGEVILGVVKVYSSHALLVFSYNLDVPPEQLYPIIEGDLLK